MGINTLRTAIDGEVIPATDTTQYKEALVGDLVPRNVSGVAEDEAGDVGSFTYQWNNMYLKNNLIIEGDVVTGATVKTVVTDTGASQVVLPSDVYKCKVQLFGAGGNGTLNGCGGSGGAYVELEIDVLSTAGRTLDLYVGTAGSGSSYLTINGEEVARAGGGINGTNNANETVLGGTPQVKPVTSSTDYRLLNIVATDGGATVNVPSIIKGYTVAGVGNAVNNGGGASILGDGGDGAVFDIGGQGAGGGGGYTDGGNASGTTSGTGGIGAIIVTYFKGTR